MGKLAWLTFTRENHLNAMNNACVDQINRIAMALKDDSDVRMVIIRGEGRAFCTGIDLKELAADRIEMDYHRRWEQALRLFETMEKLVIVGMHGYCLGGALQLALAADIRVSTAECQIGSAGDQRVTYSGPGNAAAAPLYRLGTRQKNDSGRAKYRRPEALRIGLVDHIVSLQTIFFAHLDKIADNYLASCSVGTRMSKLVTNQAFDMDYETLLQYYFELQLTVNLF